MGCLSKHQGAGCKGLHGRKEADHLMKIGRYKESAFASANRFCWRRCTQTVAPGTQHLCRARVGCRTALRKIGSQSVNGPTTSSESYMRELGQ